MKIKSETYKFTPYTKFIDILIKESRNILLDPNKEWYLLIKNENERIMFQKLLSKTSSYNCIFDPAIWRGKAIKGKIAGYNIIDLADGYIKNFSDFIELKEENENVEKK